MQGCEHKSDSGGSPASVRPLKQPFESVSRPVRDGQHPRLVSLNIIKTGLRFCPLRTGNINRHDASMHQIDAESRGNG